MTSELKLDLSSFGYADGGYMSKCSRCKETFLGAKRAWSCEPCAIKKSLEPKIIRAVPDVPELVRYGFWKDGTFEEDQNGEYVRHDQAEAVIAAKDAENKRLRSLNHYAALEAQAIKRAETAEAKLAQIEKQKPIGVFGKGNLVVDTGTYLGVPAVFVWPSPASGEVGSKVPNHLSVDHGASGLVADAWFMTFPTDIQAQAVADALCNAAPVASDYEIRTLRLAATSLLRVIEDDNQTYTAREIAIHELRAVLNRMETKT